MIVSVWESTTYWYSMVCPAPSSMGPYNKLYGIWSGTKMGNLGQWYRVICIGARQTKLVSCDADPIPLGMLKFLFCLFAPRHIASILMTIPFLSTSDPWDLNIWCILPSPLSYATSIWILFTLFPLSICVWPNQCNLLLACIKIGYAQTFLWCIHSISSLSPVPTQSFN